MAIDSSHGATALLTEHLQYTPLALIDDIIDMVNTLVYQGITSLENGMFSTPAERLGFKPVTKADGDQSEPEYPDAKQEIEEGLHKLETLLEATVDKNFDKFEIYVLRSVLSMPADLASWIRLSHYEDLPYPPPANTPTPEAVQLLRRKLAASKTVSHALDKEYNRNEAILAQLRGLTSAQKPDTMMSDAPPRFDFLTNAPSAQSFGITSTTQTQQPLRTNTTFTLSQLPALRAILAELRPKLASLHSKNLGVDSAKDERREERRGYIEQRTKAHLERNGHALADNGTVLPGKNLEPDEVEAMEKVAAIFGPS